MDYKTARRYRNKGLLRNVAEKMMGDEGQSLGSSIKSAISEKVKGTLIGFKEELDPLGIVRRITGDSGLGVVIAGKILGRSVEDIEYFSGIESGKKKKGLRKKKNPLIVDKVSTRPQPIRAKEPFADAMGKFYTIYEQKLKEDVHINDENLKLIKEKEKLDQKYHDKLIALFTGKAKTSKSEEKETNDFIKKLPDNDPSLLDDAEDIIDKSLKAISFTLALGAIAAESAKPVKAEEPQQKRTKVSGAPSASPGSYAGVEFEQVKGSIMQAEGTAGQTNPYDTVYAYGQYGKPDKPPTQMTLGEITNFQKKVLIPNTKGKIKGVDSSMGTGAIGAYQFNYTTLKEIAQEEFGNGWESKKFDKDTQDKLAKRLFDRNKKNNRMLSATWAYFRNIDEVGGYALRAQSGESTPAAPEYVVLESSGNQQEYRYKREDQTDKIPPKQVTPIPSTLQSVPTALLMPEVPNIGVGQFIGSVSSANALERKQLSSSGMVALINNNNIFNRTSVYNSAADVGINEPLLLQTQRVSVNG